MKIVRYKIITYKEEIPNSLKGFKNWEFSSGVITGEDFKIFTRKFKTFIKKNLPEEAEIVNFSRGHYFLSGFIKKNGKFVYFSIPDVRFFKNEWVNNILIRVAKSDKDYIGGNNNYTNLENFKEAVNKLLES